MNTTLTVLALLTTSIATNEVKIGTATLNGIHYDVIAMQRITNKIIALSHPVIEAPQTHFETWTNSAPGPFFVTNFVMRGPVVLSNAVIWICEP